MTFSVEQIAAITKIKEIIDGGRTFLVMPHIHPDGDSMGSCIAFCEYLRSLGKSAFVVVNESVPSYLHFFTKGYAHTTHMITSLGIGDIDAVFLLDSGDESRVEDRLEYYRKAKTRVNIDHHMTNEFFADINIVDLKASSTGEIIFLMLDHLGYELSDLSRTALYTSISSDTGSFRYSNTTARTHEIAARLKGDSLDTESINVELYQNKSFSSFQALRIALNNMDLFSNERIAISHITLSDFKKYSLHVEDVDGIVETLRDLESVEVSVFIREIENNMFKVSLRSKRFFDVTRIATQLSGGGHARAAGCRVSGGVSEAKKTLIKAINEVFKEYDQ